MSVKGLGGVMGGVKLGLELLGIMEGRRGRSIGFPLVWIANDGDVFRLFFIWIIISLKIYLRLFEFYLASMMKLELLTILT